MVAGFRPIVAMDVGPSMAKLKHVHAGLDAYTLKQTEGARIERLGKHRQADALYINVLVSYPVAFIEHLGHARRG